VAQRLDIRLTIPRAAAAYPDASHRLPIIARYFLERRTIGIGGPVPF
jgi:hypothetical protein